MLATARPSCYLSLLVVDGVEEVLLVGVERDDRTQNEQLDAARLEQLDLIGLRQGPEGADLFRHGDDAPHAQLGDVDEIRQAGSPSVNAVHYRVLRLQRRPVRLDAVEVVNGSCLAVAVM